MWSPSLSVTCLAVDIFIWSITSDDRVQRFRAVVALVALAMPVPPL